MARVDKSRVLFIKKFPDTPPAKKAPGTENECEIYITRALLEMEMQGAYDPIPANDSVAWEVKWFVRKLPDAIAVSRNKALADFVAQVISGAATGARRDGAEGMAGFRSAIFRGIDPAARPPQVGSEDIPRRCGRQSGYRFGGRPLRSGMA